jgi:ribosomal protein S18 acetylase RimI-like enzyme
MPAEVAQHDFASEVIQHAASQLAVFLRPAKLSDSEHLIHLNQAFRYEMAQWEANLSDSDGEGEGYPVLDYDDVEYILTKEDPINLIVLGRRLENEERIIGYSYCYSEPWESAVSAPARRTRTGATPRKQAAGARTKSDTPESLYLAELFIAEQERGLGLGELLLTGALHARKCSGQRSHLFVSSKNVSAVKCYLKFGYDRGTRPSGDAAHDLVMEMRNCQEGVMRSVERLSQQLITGTIGARRRRKPAALEKKDISSGDSRSASATSSSSTVAMSRASSSNGARSHPSPPPHALKPLAAKAQHCIVTDESGPTRRSNRNSERNSFELGSEPIQGRQRKVLRVVASKGDLCAKRASKPNSLPYANSAHSQKTDKGKAAVTRRTKRPKFLLTGMRTSAVANAKSVISRLAAEVIDTDVYDPSATHVIAPRSLRTEKFLCALAAGKYLLKAGYIQDCDSAGRLLPEEGYEWEVCSNRPQHLFNPDLAVSSRLRSSAALNSRTCSGSPNKSKAFSCTGNPASTTSGCFNGITAILIISEEKKECFRRVLEAGSATLNNKSFGKTVEPAAVTHAFVSRDLFSDDSEAWSEQSRRAALKQLESLQDNGVPCFYDNLIVDFLLGLDPKLSDHVVERVGSKGAKPVKHDKRKASGVVGMETAGKKTRMMTLLQPSH